MITSRSCLMSSQNKAVKDKRLQSNWHLELADHMGVTGSRRILLDCNSIFRKKGSRWSVERQLRDQILREGGNTYFDHIRIFKLGRRQIAVGAAVNGFSDLSPLLRLFPELRALEVRSTYFPGMSRTYLYVKAEDETELIQLLGDRYIATVIYENH